MTEQTNSSCAGRTLVVMLCMHRSGSSLVTNLFQRLGMSLGSFELLDGNEHNKYGHFEAVPMYQLNQELLGQIFGFTEDVPDSPQVLARLVLLPRVAGNWRPHSCPTSRLSEEGG